MIFEYFDDCDLKFFKYFGIYVSLVLLWRYWDYIYNFFLLVFLVPIVFILALILPDHQKKQLKEEVPQNIVDEFSDL